MAATARDRNGNGYERLLALVLIAAIAACGSGGGGTTSDGGPDAIFGPPLDSFGGGSGDSAPQDDGSILDATGDGLDLLFDGHVGKDGSGTPDGMPDGGSGDSIGDGEDGSAPADADAFELDIPFEDPDTGCTPTCGTRECGPDGCGAVCGFCEYGNACDDEGMCIPVCDPITPCQGKVCGPDNCGGTCGECEPSFACGDDGLCYESTCEPQCGGKECGPDGCGGVCGKCPGIKLCDTDVGKCVSDPCQGVGFKGACASKTEVVQCAAGQLVTTDCTKANPFFGCVWNALAQKYECAKPPACQPDCIELGKQCGDGGCNYSCGACFAGWSCIEFTCVPEVGAACGTVPTIGTCIGNKKYFCHKPAAGTPQILVDDCESQGKTCKFDTSSAQYQCK